MVVVKVVVRVRPRVVAFRVVAFRVVAFRVVVARVVVARVPGTVSVRTGTI